MVTSTQYKHLALELMYSREGGQCAVCHLSIYKDSAKIEFTQDGEIRLVHTKCAGKQEEVS